MIELVKNKEKNFRGDLVPYIEFISFYKGRKGWQEHISYADSTFMKVLQLDDIFMRRVLMEKEDGTGLTSDVKYKAMEQKGYNPY